MVISSEVVLKHIAVHNFLDGRLQTFDQSVIINQPNLAAQFSRALFKPFLADARFQFNIESSQPEIFSNVNNIFENPDAIVDESKNMAMQLAAKVASDDRRDGEFIVCYFEDCVLDDEVTDVIGIIKISKKENYLNFKEQNTSIQLFGEAGISLSKITQGLLIFNTDKEIGYQCMLIDKPEKGNEISWWRDTFLGVVKIKDNYFQTQVLIQNIQEFAQSNYEEEENAEKIAMINESIEYIKNNDFFDQADYSANVLQSPELIESFEGFTNEKAEEAPEQDLSHFEVSKPAIKKSKRFIRSVIKLDKNFHVYVHGNREQITKGFDSELNKHFYTLYFDEES